MHKGINFEKIRSGSYALFHPISLKDALTELHRAIQFTMEIGKWISAQEASLNFLDIEVILTNGKNIHTDIYYKDTTPHDYLNFHSAYPTYVKQSIPFNLAKRILVFVTKWKPTTRVKKLAFTM